MAKEIKYGSEARTALADRCVASGDQNGDHHVIDLL